MKPLVSIIIPVFNAEAYIAETINNALAQTWPNKELIIVDDGSTDNSLAIAKTFKNKEVKIFSQQNKGASAARNKGLKHAEGEYIQFLDADDLLSDKKIEAQVNQLIGNTGYLSLCATVHFTDGTNPASYPVKHEWFAQGSDDPADFLIKLYGADLIGPNYGGMIGVHSWLSPKHVLDKAGAWNEKLTVDDDGEFFCRVILASKGIKYSNEAKTYYRKHEHAGSLSAQKSLAAYESLFFSANSKCDNLKLATNSRLVERAFSRYYWEIGVASYPQYREFSKRAINKSIEFGNKNFKHKAGPVSTFLSKIIGWRLIRIITYLRYKA